MSVWLNLTPMVITSIWPSVVKEKTTPIDRKFQLNENYFHLRIEFFGKRLVGSNFCLQSPESARFCDASAPNIYPD